MSRIILFALLLACLVYVLQASPVPDEGPSTPSTLNLDDLSNKVKKMLDDAKETFDKLGQSLNFDKTKEMLTSAGENVKKEVEKVVDKLRE